MDLRQGIFVRWEIRPRTCGSFAQPRVIADHRFAKPGSIVTWFRRAEREESTTQINSRLWAGYFIDDACASIFRGERNCKIESFDLAIVDLYRCPADRRGRADPNESDHVRTKRSQPMLLEAGATVLVAHRRMFQHDETRFFVGALVAADHELLKLEGFTFVRDLSSGMVIRKDEKRTKVLSLASAGYIFYELPSNLNVDEIHVGNEAGEIRLMVGSQVLMNLSERSHSGHI